jgi:hypothetical protein
MLNLEEIVDRLAEVYGEPASPPSRTLLELVLLENIAYLSDDRRREQAFHELQTQVGTLAHQILAAPESALLSVAAHGILPATFAEKLRRVAQLATNEFGGDLEALRRSLWLRPGERSCGFQASARPAPRRFCSWAAATPLWDSTQTTVRSLSAQRRVHLFSDEIGRR